MSIRKNYSNNPKIATVIPAFKTSSEILNVLNNIGDEVSYIIVIDDACPDSTGELVRKTFKDKRLILLENEKNLGVGGSVLKGYGKAIELKCEVIVKIDSDGQMDPGLISKFVEPILQGNADYTKGNRFQDLSGVRQMPLTRLIGNIGLSFLSKLSSGYWEIFDPTNGFTAIHAKVAAQLPISSINKRYFFESDILFHLNLNRALVLDIPMKSKYGTEKSNLNIFKALIEFPYLHLKNLIKRIYFNYYLRNFSVASIELPLAFIALFLGTSIGLRAWSKSIQTNVPTTPGTIILSALLILSGIHLLLSFIEFDMKSSPKMSVSKFL